jgi:hypothetical protein
MLAVIWLDAVWQCSNRCSRSIWWYCRCNAIAYGWIETRLTASKESGEAITVGGEKVRLGFSTARPHVQHDGSFAMAGGALSRCPGQLCSAYLVQTCNAADGMAPVTQQQRQQRRLLLRTMLLLYTLLFARTPTVRWRMLLHLRLCQHPDDQDTHLVACCSHPGGSGHPWRRCTEGPGHHECPPGPYGYSRGGSRCHSDAGQPMG